MGRARDLQRVRNEVTGNKNFRKQENTLTVVAEPTAASNPKLKLMALFWCNWGQDGAASREIEVPRKRAGAKFVC